MPRTLHLVDRLLELAPPTRVRALKAPSYGEQLFEDHFAGFPIMPGVLMIEAMVQSAQWLARAGLGFPPADFPVTRMERVVFSDYVRPGQVMEVEVEVDGDGRHRGTVRVEGRKVATARFRLERRDLDGARPLVRAAMLRLDETFDLLGGRALMAGAAS